MVGTPPDAFAPGRFAYPAVLRPSRTPAPLFFPVAAVPHAAPLPSMRLACVDEIHLAVGCAALSDTAAIGRNQQAFDCERAGVQRNFRRGRRDPAVPDRVRPCRCDQRSRGVSPAYFRCNCIQRGFGHALAGAGCGQHRAKVFPQLAGTPCNARAIRPRERPQALRCGRLDEPCQGGKAHEIPIGCKVLDRCPGRPFVERVHEVQGGVSATPVERVCTFSHSRPCRLLRRNL
jgi:hypothetical protein